MFNVDGNRFAAACAAACVAVGVANKIPDPYKPGDPIRDDAFRAEYMHVDGTINEKVLVMLQNYSPAAAGAMSSLVGFLLFMMCFGGVLYCYMVQNQCFLPRVRSRPRQFVFRKPKKSDRLNLRTNRTIITRRDWNSADGWTTRRSVSARCGWVWAVRCKKTGKCEQGLAGCDPGTAEQDSQEQTEKHRVQKRRNLQEGEGKVACCGGVCARPVRRG
jgi:hypothetical protein